MHLLPWPNPTAPETRSAATRSVSGIAHAPADRRVMSWQLSAGMACTAAGPYPRCTSTSAAAGPPLLLLLLPLLEATPCRGKMQVYPSCCGDPRASLCT